MPVIAVINRKGGSGKSTLATHLAGWCATGGQAVMLGDVDRQQSSLGWLRRRVAQPGRASIFGWAADGRSALRPPSGVTHVVLDTPGGLRDADLARVVMYADVVLIPVGPSAFDREAAAGCYVELMALPRVATGRCRVGVVGMRMDLQSVEQVRDWTREQRIPLAGALRYAPVYVRCADQGLTLFDLPAEEHERDREQWQPVLQWLEEALRLARRADQAAKAPAKVAEGIDPRPRPSQAMGLDSSPMPLRPVNPATVAASEVQLARLSGGAPGEPVRKQSWLASVFGR